MTDIASKTGFVSMELPGNKSNDFTITYVPIKAVREYPNHAHVHDKKAVTKAKALLAAHGQIVPIVIDETGEILDGVLRYRALRELGYEELRVIIVANRDPAALKAIRLALNRLPQDAKWDDEKLRAEFSSLIELDYDLSLTGFEAVDIDMSFVVDEPAVTTAEAESEEILTLTEHSVVKAGDVWRLDRHTLVCGDARDKAIFADLVGRTGAAAAIVDLPNNMPIGGFVSGCGKTVRREFATASGEVTSGQFTDFLVDAIDALKPTLKTGAFGFFFVDWRHMGELVEAGKRCELSPVDLCVWVKADPGIGSFYRSAHELCFVYKHGDDGLANNFELNRHRRSRSNVWAYERVNVSEKDRDALSAMRPTVKPQPLLIDIIKDVTRRGETIVDTFLGSGSTLLAAEETGRTCVGVEIDPRYAEVAIRRWQKQTGKKAVHSVSCETFDDFHHRMSKAAATEVEALVVPTNSMIDFATDFAAGDSDG